MPKYFIRVRKLIRSIGSSDSKLLAAIVKGETDKKLKSDIEAMAAYILPHVPVANDEANYNENHKHSVSDASVASMVGGRNQMNLYLRFFDIREYKTLSVYDKIALKGWRFPHPDEFGQSKKRVLDARKGRNR